MCALFFHTAVQFQRHFSNAPKTTNRRSRSASVRSDLVFSPSLYLSISLSVYLRWCITFFGTVVSCAKKACWWKRCGGRGEIVKKCRHKKRESSSNRSAKARKKAAVAPAVITCFATQCNSLVFEAGVCVCAPSWWCNLCWKNAIENQAKSNRKIAKVCVRVVEEVRRAVVVGEVRQ